MKNRNHIRSLVAILGLVFVLAGYNFIRAYDESVWFPPTAGIPPARNVSAPINEGTSAQIKSGSLGVDNLSVVGNVGITSAQPYIKFSDTDAGSVIARLLYSVNTVYLQGDRDDNGSYDSPNPVTFHIGATTSQDYVTFANQVRSPQYCDGSGNNCVTDLTEDTLAGKNLLATMRAAGYPIARPPANANIDEWPNEIICEGYDVDGSKVAVFMRAHTAWVDSSGSNANYKKVRYRDSDGGRFYTFFPTGVNSARDGVVANCSSLSAGNTIKDICAAGLCIF